MIDITRDPGIVSLRIHGREMSFHADSDFAERLSQLAAEASERAEVAKRLGSRDPKQVRAFLSHAVDVLLGEGTVDDLFGEELPEVLDLMEILTGVADAFHGYRAERLRRIKEERA